MIYAQTIVQLLEQLRDRPLAERQTVRRAYGEAMQLFAGRYRACGRPFVSHLVGTASVLARYGESIELVVAGLLHAAYEQGVFPDQAEPRTILRAAVGDAIEHRVFEYHSLDLTRVPDQLTDGDRDALCMRVANVIDECGSRGMLYVGPHKRRHTLCGIPNYVAAARRLGLDAMANELDAALKDNLADPELELAGGRNESFTLTPHEHATSPRFTSRVSRRIKRLRKKVMRALRPPVK